ncbi:hypothetical protein ACS0TY_007401 [Phlomoides rotata]
MIYYVIRYFRREKGRITIMKLLWLAKPTNVMCKWFVSTFQLCLIFNCDKWDPTKLVVCSPQST